VDVSQVQTLASVTLITMPPLSSLRGVKTLQQGLLIIISKQSHGYVPVYS